jgi:hypothetical protein
MELEWIPPGLSLGTTGLGLGVPLTQQHDGSMVETSGSAKDLGEMMAHPVPHSRLPSSHPAAAPRFAHSHPGNTLLRGAGWITEPLVETWWHGLTSTL